MTAARNDSEQRLTVHAHVAEAVRAARILGGAKGDDQVAVLAGSTAGTEPAVGLVPGGCRGQIAVSDVLSRRAIHEMN